MGDVVYVVFETIINHESYAIAAFVSTDDAEKVALETDGRFVSAIPFYSQKHSDLKEATVIPNKKK